MRGIIEQARHSKSGKSLSVLIQNVWYTTKHFGLESKVGQEIVFDPKPITMGDGTVIQTIPSYTLASEGTAPTPAAAPGGSSRPAQASPPPNPYQPLVSNLAAHLIAAGKDPAELGAWYRACVALLDPEKSDDDIPF